MKYHLITRLHQELPRGLDIPDWQEFIHDKAAAVEEL
jgi:hypothetical protein